MYEARSAAKPKRIDLAIMPRDRLAAATLPATTGAFPLDAVFEFALASNFWQHGAGSPRPMLAKVDADVAKVAEYLRSCLASRGYVMVVEEADHGFPATYTEQARAASGVEVVVLQHGRALLDEKLAALHVPRVLFTFKGGAQALLGTFEGHGLLADRMLAGAEVFVMPGPMERTDRVHLALAQLADWWAS